MRTDGQTVRGNEMVMDRIKTLVKRTGERIGVATAKLVVAGYVGIVLAQVLQTY